MTAPSRLGDVISQGDLIGNVRETVRANFELWLAEKRGVPSQTPDGFFVEFLPGMVTEIAELLSRHVVQAIVFTPLVIQTPAGRIHHLLTETRATILEIAADLSRRQEDAIRARLQVPNVDPSGTALCSGCGQPAHPSETDDADRCPACIRAAGDAPLSPNEKD